MSKIPPQERFEESDQKIYLPKSHNLSRRNFLGENFFCKTNILGFRIFFQTNPPQILKIPPTGGGGPTKKKNIFFFKSFNSSGQSFFVIKVSLSHQYFGKFEKIRAFDPKFYRKIWPTS